jgi:hypothetical protein
MPRLTSPSLAGSSLAGSSLIGSSLVSLSFLYAGLTERHIEKPSVADGPVPGRKQE